MGLMSYKKYKLINEAFGNQITLGISGQTNLGLMGSHLSLEDEETIEEAKKKMLDIQVKEKPDDEGEDKDDEKDDKPAFLKGKKEKGDKEEKGEKGEKEEKGGFPFKKKKMTKEETEWWNSLKSMSAYNPNHKFDSGLQKVDEEALLPPTDPNQGLIANTEEEPQAGEPGFAPQTRIGWFM